MVVAVVVVVAGRVEERMEERSTEEARRIARSRRVSSSARGAAVSFFLGVLDVWDDDDDMGMARRARLAARSSDAVSTNSDKQPWRK